MGLIAQTKLLLKARNGAEIGRLLIKNKIKRSPYESILKAKKRNKNKSNPSTEYKVIRDENCPNTGQLAILYPKQLAELRRQQC